MIKKRLFLIFTSLILVAGIYMFILFNKVEDIESNCLGSSFEKTFKKEDSLLLNKTYDFSKIFTCQEWDKIIIVGGPEANRASIFLKEGVVLPGIDYKHRISGCLLFYFVKDGKLIAAPIEFWRSNFLYFEDLNDDDYIVLDKNNAIFKCIELDYIGDIGKILTFKLVK